MALRFPILETVVAKKFRESVCDREIVGIEKRTDNGDLLEIGFLDIRCFRLRVGESTTVCNCINLKPL